MSTRVSPAQVAAPFLNEIQQCITSSSMSPLLVGFLANDDPWAAKYAEWTSKACTEVGIKFELRACTRLELEEKIMEANKDSSVHGIMVYYPVFGAQDAYIQNIVSLQKDVEGLCHVYRYNMYNNIRYVDQENVRKSIIPCTPLAMIKILEHIGSYNSILPEGNRLHGKIITVINRSEVVGRPLAALLANDGAKVYSVDENGLLEFHRGSGLCLKKHEISETDMKLEDALKISDIVIGGVPSVNYKIPTKQLKEGMIAINFSSFKNFEEDVNIRASIFVPSVGKVTVAMLQRNLLRLYEYQMKNA